MDTETKNRQVKETTSLWEGTGLLKEIDTQEDRVVAAVVMENQRLWNEKDGSPQWKRMSIPFIRRIFGHFLPSRLVSVQPMLESTDMYLYRDKYGNVQRGEVVARTRALPVEVRKTEPSGRTKKHGGYNLEEEAKHLAKISEIAHDYICREIFSDLLKVAGSNLVHEWKSPNKFLDFLRVNAASQTNRVVGRRANWAVMPESFPEDVRNHEDFRPGKNEHSYDLPNPAVQFEGTVGMLRIFGGLKGDTVLMGYKGDNFDSGYCYCPYIMGMTVNEGTQILAHYGKKCTNKNYYVKIKVEGHSDTGKGGK
jgi:hypothetical protein